MSCEPERKSAYSSDLKYRMVWQRIAMELSVRKVAHSLSVSVGTVYNTCKLFEHTGSVDRQCKPNRVNTRKLSHYDELVILGLLLDDPGLYLGEVYAAKYLVLQASKYHLQQFATSYIDMV